MEFCHWSLGLLVDYSAETVGCISITVAEKLARTAYHAPSSVALLDKPWKGFKEAGLDDRPW